MAENIVQIGPGWLEFVGPAETRQKKQKFPPSGNAGVRQTAESNGDAVAEPVLHLAR